MSWQPSMKPIRRSKSAFTVSFEPDDRSVSTAGMDGKIISFDWKIGRSTSETTIGLKNDGGDVIPITCSKNVPGSRGLILIARSNGTIVKWDLKDNNPTATWTEPDNNIYAIAAQRDQQGVHFASAGQDGNIRLYDITNSDPIRTLNSGTTFEALTHAVRTYCLRWSKKHPSMLLSGGWDGVKIWDTRGKTPLVRNISGPQITGESVDWFQSGILAASHRPADQVELFDIGSGLKLPAAEDLSLPFLPNCLQVSKVSHSLFAVGGDGGTSATLNHSAVVCNKSFKQVGSVPKSQSTHAFHCCDFNHQDTAVAFGDGAGYLHVLEYKK